MDFAWRISLDPLRLGFESSRSAWTLAGPVLNGLCVGHFCLDFVCVGALPAPNLEIGGGNWRKLDGNFSKFFEIWGPAGPRFGGSKKFILPPPPHPSAYRNASGVPPPGGGTLTEYLGISPGYYLTGMPRELEGTGGNWGNLEGTGGNWGKSFPGKSGGACSLWHLVAACRTATSWQLVAASSPPLGACRSLSQLGPCSLWHLVAACRSLWQLVAACRSLGLEGDDRMKIGGVLEAR